jgi:AcrR family transcriptional regulator
VLGLVIEQGHDAVTVAEVARRAGLTEATVRYHFPTRDHLLISALAQADAEDSYLLVARAASTGRDLAEDLRLVVEAPVGHPNRMRLFTIEAANAVDPAHPAHSWFTARNQAVKLQLAQTLRELQAADQAHPEIDPDRFARQMVAIWDGLQTQWLIDPDFDLGAEVAAAFRSLTRADAMAARRAIAQLAAEI